MNYVYFVSYVYCDGNATVYGNAIIDRDREIDSGEDLILVQEAIEENYGYNHKPTVMGFQLLRTEKVGEDE